MILLLNIEHLFIDTFSSCLKVFPYICVISRDILSSLCLYIVFAFILYTRFLIYCSEVSFTPSPIPFLWCSTACHNYNPLCLPVNTLVFYLQWKWIKLCVKNLHTCRFNLNICCIKMEYCVTVSELFICHLKIFSIWVLYCVDRFRE